MIKRQDGRRGSVAQTSAPRGPRDGRGHFGSLTFLHNSICRKINKNKYMKTAHLHKTFKKKKKKWKCAQLWWVLLKHCHLTLLFLIAAEDDDLTRASACLLFRGHKVTFLRNSGFNPTCETMIRVKKGWVIKTDRSHGKGLRKMRKDVLAGLVFTQGNKCVLISIWWACASAALLAVPALLAG